MLILFNFFSQMYLISSKCSTAYVAFRGISKSADTARISRYLSSTRTHTFTQTHRHSHTRTVVNVRARTTAGFTFHSYMTSSSYTSTHTHTHGAATTTTTSTCVNLRMITDFHLLYSIYIQYCPSVRVTTRRF